MTLLPPGDGKEGQVLITVRVDDWLKYDYDADGVDDDPAAVARFGIYAGPEEQIYFREIFR